MIETHAHIYDQQFDHDRAAMLDRAFEAGVQQIWMPNCDHSTVDGMLRLADDYSGKCLAMMGLHPTYVKKDFEKELYLVENYLKTTKNLVAIGEIGLDYFWDVSFKEQQIEALKIQLGWAVAYNLPVVIHSRSSFNDVADVIETHFKGQLTGIFHCFTGTLESAKRAFDLGFLIGIGGVITFKNGGLDKVLPHIDLKNVVLETDCPYLAPVPHRGKRNEVVYIDLVAQRVAELTGQTRAAVIEQTSKNATFLGIGTSYNVSKVR